MKSHTSKITKGVVYILINTFLWGISPWVIKQGLSVIGPVEFLFYRFLLVSIVSIIVYRNAVYSIRQILFNPRLFLSALFFNFITLLLYFYGLNMLTPVQGGIIAGTSPLFVMIPMLLSKKEKLVEYEKVGLVAIIFGYFIVLLPNLTTGSFNWLGALLLLIGNLTFAIAVMINKQYLTNELRHAYELVSFIIALVGFSVLLMYFHHTINIFNIVNVQYLLFWPVLYMGLGASFLAVKFFNLANLHLEASETTSFAYAQPLFLMLLEVFVLHSVNLDFVKLLGISFMFFGTIVNIFGIYKEHSEHD